MRAAPNIGATSACDDAPLRPVRRRVRFVAGNDADFVRGGGVMKTPRTRREFAEAVIAELEALRQYADDNETKNESVYMGGCNGMLHADLLCDEIDEAIARVRKLGGIDADGLRDAADAPDEDEVAADNGETLASKIVIRQVGDRVHAELFIAQCDESVSGENGNPKFVASAAAVVIENAVPKVLEEGASELRQKGTRFYKTKTTEGKL